MDTTEEQAARLSKGEIALIAAAGAAVTYTAARLIYIKFSTKVAESTVDGIVNAFLPMKKQKPVHVVTDAK